MTDYRSPADEISFQLRHVADLAAIAALPGFEHADADLVDGMLEEAGRFFDEVIAPTNRDGDTSGSTLEADGTVVTAPGFADAYRRLVESGWGAVGFPEEYGGGGFPWVVHLAITDMLMAANLAFSLAPTLTHGAIDAMLQFASEEQKETYLRPMVAGEWTGTMNLTEPDAGSDVGALTTRAVPAGDGSWLLTGQKIFISWGDHDVAGNIVHLVLARTPDSPPGTKGISLFIVPKYVVTDDGSLGERNDVTCVSLEHKMGLHGSPTCVLSYGDAGGARGWMLGEEHGGMRAMFAMMNNARLSVGLQGVAAAERAYQQALAFAHERRQGRAPGAPAGEASPIVDHPDVQRMLLDMRASIAAIRGLCYRNAAVLDTASHAGDAEARADAEQLAALLIPLSKAWSTDVACDVTSTGIQVHGGMGYVEETGAAQHYRDVRVASIYEGTNGIQAIDLIARKIPMDGGAVIGRHLASIRATADAAGHVPGLGDAAAHLTAAVDAAEEATTWLLETGAADPLAGFPGAATYLELLAVTTGGDILVAAAVAAAEHIDPDGAVDRAVLARHFASTRLARVPGMVAGVTSLGDDLAAARTRLLDV